MELINYYKSVTPGLLMVVLGAVAGAYYLKKAPASSVWLKLFVYYLWFTVLIEVLATYAVIGHFSNYKYFSFIKDTSLERNFWVYNIFTLVSYPFLIFFFTSYVKSLGTKKYARYLAIALLIGFSIYFAVNPVFFEGYSPYVDFIGTFFLFFAIVLFYFEVLRSEYILKLKHFLPFYLSIGILVFYLCVTPLSIFSKYFRTSTGNAEFVELQVNVILFSNIFMYSCFILGFIVCSRKNKSY